MKKMKLIWEILGCALLVFALLPCSSITANASARAASDMKVLFPADRGIFQRDSDGLADIPVRVSFKDGEEVYARVMCEDEELFEWTELENTADSEYSIVFESVPEGGWYQIEIEAIDTDSGSASTEVLEHIGVGEVFITAGQSNSCSMGGTKMKSQYDTVSAFDAATEKWQHCEDSQPDNSGYGVANGGGSPWPTLGDKLSERLGVPIGFVTTGFGGSTVEELRTIHYHAIKEAIEKLAPYGYRAVLYHQGENDANNGTSTAAYSASLEQLIEQTRADAGYDLNWIVAQVSYASWHSQANMEAVKAGQRAVCNNYDIFVGPTTDDMLGDYRYTDNLHFSEKGLIEHGTRWADVIMTKLFTEYDVKVDASMKNGTIILKKDSYFAGDWVTFQVEAEDEYYLVEDSVEVVGQSGKISAENNAFTMRAEDLTVKAEFKKLPEHLISLKAVIEEAESIDYGKYEETGIEALKTIIEQAKSVCGDPDTSEKTAEEYRESIIDALENLVLKARDVFEDIKEGDWYYDAVYYNYDMGIMTGMDETHFGPYGQLSRAQFAVILHRIAGAAAVDTAKHFGDIAGDEWYGPAVLWAAENGIVTGYQNGNFGPADMITREQMALMMYRYANYLGKDTTTKGDISTFQDAASVSGFAAEAMQWANGTGIITGKENGTRLDPQGNTARAEAAVIIQRFMK